MLQPRWAALVCVIMVTITGCARTSSGPEDDGILRMAVPQDPKTLNPLLESSTIDGSVQRLMFEPLISADPQGREVPVLATQVPSLENHGISPDGLTVTYRLRPGAHWTDGVAVTSQDVAFSWTAVMNPDNNVVSRHGYDDVSRIDIPDAHTVVVHLRSPLASFVDTFFAESDAPYAIVPAHVLQRYSNLNTVPFNSRPQVSDGPFRFVRWLHGDRIVLAANEHFFLGKPKLHGIEVQTVPNEDTAVNLLRTGAVDYMYQASIITYPQLRSLPNVRLVWLNMNGYEGMIFNMRKAPMKDQRFRDAVTDAIDKRELVRTLTYGQEKIAGADLPDWMWASNPNIPAGARDVRAARSLLHAAGLQTPISLTLVTDTANVTHKREAVMIQAMLRDVGINLEVKTYPGDLLYAPAGMGGILNGGKFDIALWPWYAGLDPDNSSELLCANVSPHGYNESAYCSPAMDRLQHQALTRYSRGDRKIAYEAIERLMAHDKPIIVFWWQRQQEALRPNVGGFAPNPVQETWNAWQWSK